MSNHQKPVPDWLNSSYVEKILAIHFADPYIRVLDIDIKPGSKEGDNFLGQVLRLTINLEQNKKVNILKLIAKLCPETKFNEDMNGATDMFVTESSFFLRLQKKLIEANDDIRRISPLCYHVDIKHKTILMEDLMVKNFRMVSKADLLPLQPALVVVEALAAFHGASLKVLKNDPSFKETHTFHFWSGNPIPVIDKWFTNNCIALKRNVGSYGVPEEWCKRISNLESRLKPDYVKVCDYQEGRLNVILHGDPWLNNLLFHFNADGIADEVMMLDYQMVYYNCFANDLIYFIFSSLKAQTIIDHLDEILIKYYTEFKAAAPELPNLTLERVKSEFEERLFFGYLLVLMFRSNLLADDPPDMERIAEGELYEKGFQSTRFISDLKILLPFFEERGIF